MEESRPTDETSPLADKPADENPTAGELPLTVPETPPPPVPADANEPGQTVSSPFVYPPRNRPFAVAHGITGYGAAQEATDPFLEGFNAE